MLKQSKDLKDMRAAPLQQTENISVVLSVFSSIAPIYYEWKEEKRQPCTATKTDAIIHIILMQYYIIYSRLYTLVLMLSFWFEYVFIYFLLLRYNSPGFSWMYFFSLLLVGRDIFYFLVASDVCIPTFLTLSCHLITSATQLPHLLSLSFESLPSTRRQSWRVLSFHQTSGHREIKA